MKIISGLRELAASYDVLVCDIWGVIHNGREAFPGVVETLRRFREQGTVLLLSNAPRPNAPIREQLASLSVTADAYDELVTSGDLTRRLLIERGPLNIHRVGPDRDWPLFDGLDIRLVAMKEADAIVCTGPFDDTTEGPDDYRDYWHDALARRLPFYCANPDLVVQRGDQMIYCAGALAHQYEEQGGDVLYLGKPHAPAYDFVAERLRELMGRDIPKAKWLAVGDGLKTDIAGATQVGIDSLLITGGIHESELAHSDGTPDPAKIDRLFAERKLKSVAAMRRLLW